MIADRMRAMTVAGSSWPDTNGYIYNEGEYEDYWVAGYVNHEDATFSKETGYLFLENWRIGYEVGCVTDEAVNLTNFNYIKIYGTGLTYSLYTFSVDVSGLSGSYFIRFHIQATEYYASLHMIASSVRMGNCSVYDAITTHWLMSTQESKIYKVWLE